MSALGPHYRFRVVNTQNRVIRTILRARRFKYGTDGSLTYETATTPIASTDIAATSGTAVSSDSDNTGSADRWLGVVLTLTTTALTTATDGTGTVAIFLDNSTDNTVYPDSGRGILIGAYTVTVANALTLVVSGFLRR